GKRSLTGVPVNESIILLVLAPLKDAARLPKLRDGLLKVFADVRIAVRDWRPILDRLADTVSGLKTNPPRIAPGELAENLAFLDWLADNHFTFLGCRDYVFDAKGEGRLDARYETGLGVLTDPEARVLRRGPDRSSLT